MQNKEISYIEEFNKRSFKLSNDEKVKFINVHISMLIRLQKIRGFLEFNIKNTTKWTCDLYIAEMLYKTDPIHDYFWDAINIYTTSLFSIYNLLKKNQSLIDYLLPINEDYKIYIESWNFFYSCIHNSFNPFAPDEFTRTDHSILEIKPDKSHIISYARVVSSMNLFFTNFLKKDKLLILKSINFFFRRLRENNENIPEIKMIVKDYSHIEKQINLKIQECEEKISLQESFYQNLTNNKIQ